METRSINLEDRAQEGTSAVRNLRKTGQIPGVIYATGRESLSVLMNAHEFQMAARGARPTQLFKISSKNKSIDGKLSLIKAVQLEPVKGKVLHVDFLELKEGHRITVSVQLVLKGESAAVKENRAFLNQTAYEVDVECLPTEIPESVAVDITKLEEGGSLHASNVELPKGVTLKSLAGMTVVTAISMKAMIAAEEEAAAAAAAVAQGGGAAQQAAAAAAAQAAEAPAAAAAGGAAAGADAKAAPDAKAAAAKGKEK